MKIMVNYDLLSKIATSKTGLALDKTVKRAAKYSLIAQGILLPLDLLANFTQEQFLAQLLRTISVEFSAVGISDIICIKRSKELAIRDLKILAYVLKKIDINTNYDLLVESYKYRTDYKVEFNDSKIPKIKQEKYIVVPIYEDGEEKEISVLQEHIIGSKNYELSIGEPTPQKRLKLVHGSI